MKGPHGRRNFLRKAAPAVAGLVLLRNSRSVSTAQANEKLNVALVGVGGRGKWFVDTLPTLGANVVALCDVDRERAAEAFAKFPDTPKYSDFREMLEELDERIDAVICATPDHTHAVIAMAALKKSKHVLCEKPLTHNVREARALREAARARNVATQMGNQGTASPGFRRALELIRGAVLGEIRNVYVWKDSGGSGLRPRPQGTPPVPETFCWDLWLGPAPKRDYHPEWRQWHTWRDFGTGCLGNWASHTANLAFMALQVDLLWRVEATFRPRIRVEAQVSEMVRDTFPRWEMIRFEVPARANLPPVTFHYYNGGGAPGARTEIESLLGRPLDWGDHGEKKWADHAGCLIVGSEGKLWTNGHNTEFALLPEERFAGFQGPPESLPRSPGHEREWLEACRGGPPAWSNFEYAVPLAEFLHLGNVATQFDRAVEFDPLICTIVGDTEADKALGREYREGWTL